MYIGPGGICETDCYTYKSTHLCQGPPPPPPPPPSSSCEATVIIVLIILSLYGRSAAKNNNKMVLDYCSLEALDTNVSMVLASMTSWDRSFQSLMVLGRNEYYWY